MSRQWSGALLAHQLGMNKHLMIFSILCSLYSFNSNAQSPSCPILTGVYTCGERTQNPFRLSVTEIPIGNQMAIDFNSTVEGYHRYIPDGTPQQLESGFGKGTYSTVCQNGWLITTFLLTRPDGSAFHVQDKMQMQRKAIVNIRTYLAGARPNETPKPPEVHVCRPYFAKPN